MNEQSRLFHELLEVGDIYSLDQQISQNVFDAFPKHSLNWMRYYILVNDTESVYECFKYLVHSGNHSLRKKHFTMLLDHFEQKGHLGRCGHLFRKYYHMWELEDSDLARAVRLRDIDMLSRCVGLPLCVDEGDLVLNKEKVIKTEECPVRLQLLPINFEIVNRSLRVSSSDIKRFRLVEYVVDGANILSSFGYTGKGWTHPETYRRFSAFCEGLPGTYCVVFTAYNANKPHFKWFRHRHRNSLVIVDKKDDEFIIALGAYNNCYIVSNDRFRNHIFADKTNSLRNWLPEHLLHVDVYQGCINTPETQISQRVQVGVDGNFYIPTTNGDWVYLPLYSEFIERKQRKKNERLLQVQSCEDGGCND